MDADDRHVVSGLPKTAVGRAGSTTALDEAAIVATTDVTGRIVYVNDKFCQISGYSEEELVNSNHRLLRSGVHDKEFFRAMYRTIAQGETWHGELCNKAKSGDLYWVDTTIVPRRASNGRIAFYDAIRFDITPLKKAEERLWVDAHTDALTGLPNRKRFVSHLAAKVRTFGAQGASFALCLLDLDGFKDLNDSFGHDAGDRFLQVVASRLVELLGTEIAVARLGGDEFTLIIPSEPKSLTLLNMLEDVVETLRMPIEIEGYQRRCSASIGVTMFPSEAAEPSELMKNADIALYRAKARGRDRYELFDPEMAKAVALRTALRQEAETGLENGEFLLFFQPIVDITSSKPALKGFEALLRWRHPSLGLVGPGRFGELFDDPGLCAEIGRAVSRMAIDQGAEWRAKGLEFEKIAINVTSADLRSEQFGPSLLENIRAAKLEPHHFCIEVTEGMFLGRGSERIFAALEWLHNAGLKIALDDFGTGFASLTHLKSLPIDRIKIDRSFVDKIEQDRANSAIVHGLIRIAHSLDLLVTAEGIETQSQLHELTRFGCDQAQGYLIAKPMPPSRVAHFMSRFQERLLKKAG